MNYIISANTDIGIKKNTNQDSLAMKVLNTPTGQIAFAVLCDGMGGLAKGELASATVVRAFMEWSEQSLPVLCTEGNIEDWQIKAQWEAIVTSQNQRILNYGREHGVNLGTTLVAMLLTDQRYYIMNVGDSRAYELSSWMRQLTEDQTVVAREIKNGILTEEQAAVDPRRNVLLQCVGASQEVHPDMFFGETRSNAVYMLCSDGFRHEITSDEIFFHLRPDALQDAAGMKQSIEYLTQLNKERQETDNISAALIRTY